MVRGESVAERKLMRMVLVTLGGLVGLAVGGCRTAPAHAPTISVVTTIYPLAQAVSAIGGSTVAVTDLATAGVDPATMPLTAAQAERIRRAAVVVEVGGGFQPAVEAAATGSTRLVSLAPRFGDGSWLAPATMENILPIISAALMAANPKAASSYRNGERDFYEQVSSASNDYQAALSACPRNQIAAPDAALDTMASDYRLRLHQLGTSASPSPAQVTDGAATISSSETTTVFSEPWVPAETIDAVAARTGAKVRVFDTLEAPPAGGWPPHNSYIIGVENNLHTLASALGCPDSTGSQS